MAGRVNLKLLTDFFNTIGHKATYAVQQENINKSRLDALNR